MVSSLLRIVSVVLCLIAVGWFAGFAVEQSKTASAHQQHELSGTLSSEQKPAPKHESGFREAIDKAFAKISSPYSGLTEGLGNKWLHNGANLLLALLIYGLALGFLARSLRFGT